MSYRWILMFLVLGGAAATAAPAGDVTGSALAIDPDPVWADVSAIFQMRCVNCHARHGAGKGLRLDSYEAALEGSDNGPVFRPGDPSGSEMIRRLRGESPPRMPFLAPPLPPEEIDIIVRWIAAGLPETRP